MALTWLTKCLGLLRAATHFECIADRRLLLTREFYFEVNMMSLGSQGESFCFRGERRDWEAVLSRHF